MSLGPWDLGFHWTLEFETWAFAVRSRHFFFAAFLADFFAAFFGAAAAFAAFFLAAFGAVDELLVFFPPKT